MDVFEESDYKTSLKLRLKDLQPSRPSLTWRKLASEIPVQYTYLSRAMNNDHTHLSDDHLFVLCQALEFLPDELDFILLQRAHTVARDAERKTHLYRKIRDAKRARGLNADEPQINSSNFNEQVRYLLDPLCTIVHVALFVRSIQKDPRRLLSELSITMDQLKEYLRILSRNDYIDLDEDGLSIKKVHAAKLHFGRDHFLMRNYLSLSRAQMVSRLARTPDEDKYSFLITFNLDESSFEKVKSEFQTFLKRVEKIAQETRDQGVYQLGFDLLKWL